MLINGEKLKSLRNEHGLSQKEVALKLDVTEATVSRYEGGQIKRVSPRIIMGYSNLFHVPINELYENPETEWVTAFSGQGLSDPRVQGFIEYLEEQAQKEADETHLTPRERELVKKYRFSDEKTCRLVDYALGLTGCMDTEENNGEEEQ